MPELPLPLLGTGLEGVLPVDAPTVVAAGAADVWDDLLARSPPKPWLPMKIDIIV